MTVEYSKREKLNDIEAILSYYAETAEPGVVDRFERRFHEVMVRIERQPASA